MRIIITSDLHWPFRNGVATFGRMLAQGLAEAGHEVLVIAPSPTGRRFSEVDENHRVERIASLPLLVFPAYRVCLNPQAAVKKIITAFKPDIIHIQTPLSIGYAARQIAKKQNIPLMATNHAMPENILDNLRAIGPFARPVVYLLKEYGTWFHGNSIDYITMPTKTAVRMFKDIHKKFDIPVKAISCGVNLDHFSPGKRNTKLMAKYHIPTDKPIVLYAGRLDAEKHLWVVINAFYQLLQQLDAHLVISGGGNDEDNLRNQVAGLGLTKRVSFLGRVSDDELPDVYRLGDVFVMPSPAELQSIVTLEAMATGLPVIAVDAGPLYELCQNGKNGYLSKVDEPGSMAKQLIKLLTDKKGQVKMGQKSLAIAKTHDIHQTIKEYVAAYTDAIKRHSRKKPA